MRWNNWIRQIHRWISIVFTLLVIINMVCMFILEGQQPPNSLTYAPIVPLFVLLLSGVYLFVLPYVSKIRALKQHE